MTYIFVELHFILFQDIKINVMTPKSVLIGSDIEIIVEVSNSAGVSKSLTGKMMCEVTKYTGAAVSICKEEAFDVEIEAYQRKLIKCFSSLWIVYGSTSELNVLQMYGNTN